jgi:hydroxymethylpyrimidine pyrophosphatase-like HAD family hydrolase
MNAGIQAIAVDYDGTLTESDRPTDDLLAAVHEARRRGRAVVLVTGRILSELRAVFPEVDEVFDAIVAENGAVLADADGVHDLAAPIDPALAQALAHREVPVRQGRVLLACDAPHAGTVAEEIARLGLDGQVVRNRGALMVLPGGVTKGTGLSQALGNLGISRHSTLAIGDAENDHHLLGVCELGVAVANAVDSLKQVADLVLEQCDGAGVAAFLRGPVIAGDRALTPGRWRLDLGLDGTGNGVEVPASQINLLIVGASGSGKSYLAGLLVEQLVRMDYSVLILDREGDHRTLAERRGILAVGGRDPLPTPVQLAALLRHRFGSIVVDLSSLGEQEQRDYVASIAPTILAQRAVTGLPHWIFMDEAHALPLDDGPWAEAFAAADKGFCLSTYLPDHLPQQVGGSMDHLLLCAGTGTQEREVLGYAERVSGTDADELAALLGEELGHTLHVDAADMGRPRAFTVSRRSSGHIRHWHKYIDGELPDHLRFYFTDGGPVAGNLRDFHRHLTSCPAAMITSHGQAHDFSRWIRMVVQDEDLADAIESTERRLRRTQIDTEMFRHAVQAAIETRYLDH